MGRPTITSKSTPVADSSEMMESVGIGLRHHDANRIVVLYGDVNEQSISNVIAQLFFHANDSTRPINLVISTCGGSVDEMFALYDVIKFLPCPVHTFALGKVMSAGILLLASGAKGHRMVGKSARLMIHPISSGMGGNLFEIINETNELKRMQANMVEALVNESSMTKKQLEQLMAKGTDKYLTPEEAIKLGIVDKVIGR